MERESVTGSEDRLLVGIEEAARLLCLSRRTVEREIAGWNLLAVPVRGKRMIAVEDLRRYVDTKRTIALQVRARRVPASPVCGPKGSVQ
jgi:hypothetical protein